jgi:hypothetical protein
MKADYAVIHVESDRVFIVDLEMRGISITNSAAAVARDLQARYLHRRVIYRDSAGCWTEMRINAKNEVLFAPYNEHVPDCDIEYLETTHAHGFC